MPEADGQAERGPGRAEQEGDHDRARADDEGRDDGAAQHLGQRVAPEVREPVEHVHGRTLYRYVRICLIDAEGGCGQPSARPTSRKAGRRCGTRCPATARAPTPAPTQTAADRPMLRKATAPGERLGLLGRVATGLSGSAHPSGRARRSSPDHACDCCPLMRCVARRSPSSAMAAWAAPDEARWTGYTGAHHRIWARMRVQTVTTGTGPPR